MKIKTSGLYDISFEDYFSDLCPAHSVSSTGLKVIEQKSLAHYWHQSYLNPAREPHDTPALAFGRACHSWVLGEPVFNQYFVISPYHNFKTKEARVWRDGQNRTIVSASQLEQIKAMAAQLQRDKLLRNVFIDGLPERSLIWKDRETGIWLKSRPDWLPNTLRLVPDFKTCASAKPEAFAKAAFGLGYHMSAALCLDGLREVLGWTNAAYYFVAQEKEPPHVAIPFTMRDEDIEMGRLLNRSALRRLAKALEKNHWPAYAEGAVEIMMPAWSEKLFLDRHTAGEFETKEEVAA